MQDDIITNTVLLNVVLLKMKAMERDIAVNSSDIKAFVEILLSGYPKKNKKGIIETVLAMDDFVDMFTLGIQQDVIGKIKTKKKKIRKIRY